MKRLVASGMEFSRKVQIVLGAGFEAAVEDEILLAAVGDNLDLANNDVVAGFTACNTVHLGREGELELADAVGMDGELRTADAARFDSNGLFGAVVVQ